LSLLSLLSLLFLSLSLAPAIGLTPAELEVEVGVVETAEAAAEAFEVVFEVVWLALLLVRAPERPLLTTPEVVFELTFNVCCPPPLLPTTPDDALLKL
jgi:hypothetical protein